MAKVLVVDDDSALCNDIADKLGDWGHEILVAPDGRAGFDLIRTWVPDLVLSDINMPCETGFDLVNRLNQLDIRYAHVVFLFISSLTAPNIMVFGIQNGADDYITKPINYELLRVKIDAALRKRNNLASKLRLEWFSKTVTTGATTGIAFTGLVFMAGVCALFSLYWLKTALGINIFADIHLRDLI